MFPPFKLLWLLAHMWPVHPRAPAAEPSVMSFVCQLSPSLSHDPAAASLTPVSPRRSAGYTQKRLTENLKVPYYVAEHFSKEFTGVILRNLEKTVEDDYISSLRNNCWKEKQQSMSFKWAWNSFRVTVQDWLCPRRGFLPCFLQRRACCTELATLETAICTRGLRELARRAAPSCQRSRLR